MPTALCSGGQRRHRDPVVLARPRRRPVAHHLGTRRRRAVRGSVPDRLPGGDGGIFRSSWSFIVPDVRWFPRPLVASRVTTALVDGQPSSWLTGAVKNAFPDELSLVGRSVTLSSGGVAQVQLPQAALSLDRTTLDRMQTQLTRSLVTAGISEVQMTVDGTPIPASELPVKVTRVDPSPAVLTEGGTFGVLSGESVDTIPALSDAVESLSPTSIELEADRSLAAVLTQQGAVASALSDGSTFLLDDRGPAPDRQRLAGRLGGGVVPDLARRHAHRGRGDGGGRPRGVAGRHRPRGTAVSLGPPHVLSFSEPGAFDLAWLDDTTVGVLTAVDGASRLDELSVGGRGTVGTVPESARAIAGGSASVRILDGTGRLFSRRGSSWTLVASDIRVLAVQQGTTS
ncbi:hypothetical protein LUZ63_023242 [Rhynchospora breviuscula]|uniref:GerMN domain-containing protein n=1 Tax=Rhynchospora breviuscula TaxID=2022672 RepID=A0A9P9Z3C8_9POAL|nr:hypothetical protein LUZ63_023242 [Rhynchospora breviuscula]